MFSADFYDENPEEFVMQAFSIALPNRKTSVSELILAAKCASDVNVQKMGFQLLISWVDNDNISLQEDVLALSAIDFKSDNEDLIWWWLQIVSRALHCQNLDRERKPSSECVALAKKVFSYCQKITSFIKMELEENWKDKDISPEMSNFDEFRVCGALSGLCATIFNPFFNKFVTQLKPLFNLISLKKIIRLQNSLTGFSKTMISNSRKSSLQTTISSLISCSPAAKICVYLAFVLSWIILIMIARYFSTCSSRRNLSKRSLFCFNCSKPRVCREKSENS